MKKKILIIAGAVLFIGLCGAAYWVSKQPSKASNGWESTQTSIDDADWGTEIESALDYHVEKVNKDDFKKMSDFEYIDTVTSVLNAYNDKVWVLFLFDDGTGIQYPGSDISETANYGKFDDHYSMTEQLGFVSIAGNTVTYQDVPSTMSKETNDLSQAIPSEYGNDYTYVNVKDGIAYVQVLTTKDDTQSVASEIAEAVKDVGDYEEIHFCIKHNEDLNYYRYKLSDGSMETITTPDQSFFEENDVANEEESE